MGRNKRDYMQIHDPLADRYYNVIRKMVEEEQMIYETLCDYRSKSK